jgi:hypothetical protein
MMVGDWILADERRDEYEVEGCERALLPCSVLARLAPLLDSAWRREVGEESYLMNPVGAIRASPVPLFSN